MNRVDEIIKQHLEKRFEVPKDLEKKLFSIPRSFVQRTESWHYWLVAASVILLLSFHLVKMSTNESPQNEELIEVYNESWDNQL